MTRVWNNGQIVKREKIEKVSDITSTKIVPTNKIVPFLEGVINPGDIVILEGDNQKQAAFLSEALANVNPEIVNELHMVISSISRPEHLDIFEKKIASIVDFAYAGGVSLRISDMIEKGTIKIGSINTYLELYGRVFVDLIPNVCLVAAEKADAQGNLYTGANTEDTPTWVEATAFKNGIVIVQVNEIVDKVDRVDIPADWVDFVVVADKPYPMEPLFTRDPKIIKNEHILMAMMAIKGIYAKHNVRALNHGVGFNTAAIELLLPTYAESLGLKGKICEHWVLNPHPTIIPAIEAGWVKSICSFGGELGTSEYVKARPDIFFTGCDGTLRSNRAMAQTAGLYGVDMFVGSTLQMDYYGNSSTVTAGRLTGFGGAPNMGHNCNGRRHSSDAWQSLITEKSDTAKGRKLVVQMFSTTRKAGTISNIVEQLDAVDVGRKAGLPVAPIMIYGEDVSHVVTEIGIAYLYKAKDDEERKLILAGVAGKTELGQSISEEQRLELRRKGYIALPEDLDIKPEDVNRNLLAVQSLDELVTLTDGLYQVPDKFKNK